MKKVLKCIVIVVGALLFLLFGLLTFNYVYNEITISKYNEHDYSYNEDVLTYTNITQTYIVYYNNGNAHYQKGEYEEAIEDYKEALQHDPPHKYEECDIRVNLALAIIETLPEDYDALENIEQSIAILEEAREYLLEEDCAEDDEDGHDKDAQKLKEEIDELIEQLKKKQQSSGGGGDNNQQQPEPEEEQLENDSQDSYEQEIKEELQDLQEQAHQEREDTLQLYEELDSNADYNWNGTIW